MVLFVLVCQCVVVRWCAWGLGVGCVLCVGDVRSGGWLEGRCSTGGVVVGGGITPWGGGRGGDKIPWGGEQGGDRYPGEGTGRG